MRLLIAGWQGQIAQALMEGIAKRTDVKACALGRPALDICELRTIERAMSDIRPNIVINAAGYTNVDNAEIEPERAFALNRDGARLLAAAANQRNVPIIHISTDYVFDGTRAAPYVETDEPHPMTVYGQSKLEGEAAVRTANPKHLILRTAWIYSPFGRNFVKTIIQRARSGARLRVVADQRGSPTYAPHLVDMILEIASRAVHDAASAPITWGTYHAAGNGSASWLDLAREALELSPDVAQFSGSIEAISAAEFPTRAPRPTYVVLDCSKIEREFNLKMPAWQLGIADCAKRLLPV